MIIKSANEMINLAYRSGVQLTKSIEQDIVIYLSGDLGSGKTTFTKGLIRGLGFEELVKRMVSSDIENAKEEQGVSL